MGKRYYIYIHTFPNDKVYIGITCRNPKYRWDNGNGYQKSQRKMYNAIQKYGWENVKHEILYEDLTKEEAEQKEIELIAKYNSTNDMCGYNIEKGGNANKEITQETRALMRKNHKGTTGRKRPKKECEMIGFYSKQRWEAMTKEQKQERLSKLKMFKKGEPSWNKGLSFSEEARKNMSIAQKKRFENGAIPPMKGKTLSEESREKIRQKKLGFKHNKKSKEKMKINNKNAKKIIVLETKQIFNSGKECAEALGVHRSNPNFVCNGRTKTCKGYHLMWLDDYTKELNQRKSEMANQLANVVF